MPLAGGAEKPACKPDRLAKDAAPHRIGRATDVRQRQERPSTIVDRPAEVQFSAELCYAFAMQVYRFRWLVCFAIAVCLIAGATLHAAGLRIQSPRAEISWDSNPDAAVLTRTTSAAVMRSAPRTQPEAFKSRFPTPREAESARLPAGRYTLLTRRNLRLERGSSYLERTNDKPRAPPQTRSA